MQVDQKHARILREALARLTKLGNPFVTTLAIAALREYAVAIMPTCQCVDTVFLPKENKNACLDCGRRANVSPAEQPDLYIPPSEL